MVFGSSPGAVNFHQKAAIFAVFRLCTLFNFVMYCIGWLEMLPFNVSDSTLAFHSSSPIKSPLKLELMYGAQLLKRNTFICYSSSF